MSLGASALFVFDLALTAVVITAGVQLGRLYRHFRPADGSDGGGPPWRYGPQRPPDPGSRPVRRPAGRRGHKPVSGAAASRSRRWSGIPAGARPGHSAHKLPRRMRTQRSASC